MTLEKSERFNSEELGSASWQLFDETIDICQQMVYNVKCYTG